MRLPSIKFPEFFTRAIENLDIASWKANQFRLWLFYYFAVCRDLVNRDFFDHFSLLVEAISRLSTNCISEHDLFVADTLLRKFCADFQNLYGTYAA